MPSSQTKNKIKVNLFSSHFWQTFTPWIYKAGQKSNNINQWEETPPSSPGISYLRSPGPSGCRRRVPPAWCCRPAPAPGSARTSSPPAWTRRTGTSRSPRSPPSGTAQPAWWKHENSMVLRIRRERTGIILGSRSLQFQIGYSAPGQISVLFCMFIGLFLHL